MSPALDELIDHPADLTFQQYMATCLYHPAQGYYARRGDPTVSKKGDFITSVSVGSCFGTILAHRIYQFWKELGSPADYVLTEIGAHDGSLALDVLSAAAGLDPDFRTALSYRVVEPLPLRRESLRERLAGRAEVLSSPRFAPRGCILANEVLDALPVPLLTFVEGQWREVLVTKAEGPLEFALSRSSTAAVDWMTENQGSDFPENYVTEGPPDFVGFLQPFVGSLGKGHFLFIDYGLDEESLYSSSRSVGTFRCYRGQRKDTHPLDYPGRQDLTADVNFTRWEMAARSLELAPSPIISQARYLPNAGRDWLLGQPPADLVRQFQTLIHPSQFGSRFYVSELRKDLS